VRSLVAVVARAWCTTNVFGRNGFGSDRKSSDTLLGFETTSPLFQGFPWRRVVALLWWWGVVFDLWIVVASI
jgi:hypothetical protein